MPPTTKPGTKFFVQADEDFPDDAHRFILRQDQFVLGYLHTDQRTAEWIAQCLEENKEKMP